MTDKKRDLHSLPIPEPYLVAATDEYYGVTPSYEEKQVMKKRKKKKKRKKGKKREKSKKLRILITTYWDYPVVGGLQSYIATLKAGLEKLGHTVDIFAPNHFPQDVKKLKRKIEKETKQFYMNRYGDVRKEIVKENRRLSIYEMALETLDLEKYDIFHAQDRFTANVLGRLNRYYQKPLFFTPHGFMTQRKLQFNLLEQDSVEAAYYLSLDRKAIESATHVITLCEVFRPMLQRLGAEDHKMTTVYTGIDFKPIDQKKTIVTTKDKLVITCVSRLRPRKGHKHLFEALALMKRKLKNVEVWIVGDGEMRDQLESQVKELGLHNVSFLGERNDVPELLSRSDLFVLPTTSDTVPIALIEAMFANKPIITTNVGGIPEIIQNRHTGLLVEPGNPQQLVRKISLLLRNKALRETLVQNAEAFANQHLTSKCMIKKIEEIYKSHKTEEVK